MSAAEPGLAVPLPPGAPRWAGVVRYRDPAALADAAAAQVASAATAALAARPRFELALPGGSTPRALFTALASPPHRALPWARVGLWLGDERAVPPDHPDSNYGQLRELLLRPLGLATAACHRLRGEARELATAAAEAEAALVTALGAPPALDLVVLGLGADGHTASWFPHSPAVHAALGRGAAGPPWICANPVDSPLCGGKTTRLTLTPAAVWCARRVLVVVAGADKAPALAQVLLGESEPARYPAQLLARVAEKVQWFIADNATPHFGDST